MITSSNNNAKPYYSRADKKNFKLTNILFPFFKESVFIASCWNNVKHQLLSRQKILEQKVNTNRKQ